MTELRELWHETFGMAPAPNAQREPLVWCLTYRLQERSSGEMSSTTRRQLTKLARELTAGSVPQLLNTSRIKSGTRLIREWQGKTHEVIVVDDGFRYRDKEYRSLSIIARLITGTRWSGPVFFGLRRPGSTSNDSPTSDKNIGKP